MSLHLIIKFMYKITEKTLKYYDKKTGKVIRTYYKKNSEKFIKDKCFWCGNKIAGTWEYYCTHGNCCSVCSRRFDVKVKKKDSFVEKMKPLLADIGSILRTRTMRDKKKINKSKL